MKKDKLLLILCGCAATIAGTFYLQWFGFEESPFKLRVPLPSAPRWKNPSDGIVFIVKVMNKLLSLIDWVILIGIVVILIGIVVILLLIGLKGAKYLVVSLFQRNRSSKNVESPEEYREE